MAEAEANRTPEEKLVNSPVVIPWGSGTIEVRRLPFHQKFMLQGWMLRRLLPAVDKAGGGFDMRSLLYTVAADPAGLLREFAEIALFWKKPDGSGPNQGRTIDSMLWDEEATVDQAKAVIETVIAVNKMGTELNQGLGGEAESPTPLPTN